MRFNAAIGSNSSRTTKSVVLGSIRSFNYCKHSIIWAFIFNILAGFSGFLIKGYESRDSKGRAWNKCSTCTMLIVFVYCCFLDSLFCEYVDLRFPIILKSVTCCYICTWRVQLCGSVPVPCYSCEWFCLCCISGFAWHVYSFISVSSKKHLL